MTPFLSMFGADFLLRNALWGSLAAGLVCPLIGIYFLLRRMTLLGVALPQVSTAGISFAFFLQAQGILSHGAESSEQIVALGGSLLFTVLTLVILAFLDRRGQATTEHRIGALYALTFAAAMLFVVANPQGEIEILHMLHGEIVSIRGEDLWLLLQGYALLVAALLVFNNQFLLVSFDRESAKVMGKNVAAWDIFLYGLIGLALTISVMIVGPMLTFAFLIIPPLAARRFCKRMGSFFLLSSLIGGVSGVLGFYLSYRWDWPLGPTDIAVACALLGISVGIKKGLEILPKNALPPPTH